MPKPSPKEWLCPLCDHVCPFGTMGCSEPNSCELGEKNIHWYLRTKISEEKAIGIALISDEESNGQ